MQSANIPNNTRKAVYRRDAYHCCLCDDVAGLQIHHVVPRAQGGTHSPHNLVTLCWRCHALAHGTRLQEWPYCDTTQAEINQAIVEYISDLYAEQGLAWSPWGLG